MTDEFFATGYIRVLYRFARAEGLSSQALFTSTHCCETDLMRPDFEMPFAAQMRMVENALLNAPSGLGLRVGLQLQLAAHGALGTAMQSAPTLQDALDTFVQFLPMRASFFSVSHERSRDESVVEISLRALPAKLVPFFSESILYTLTHCVAFYTGQREGWRRIELAYAEPDYGHDYPLAFGNSIFFECESTRVSFDRSLLAMPSPEANAEIYEESLRLCRTRMPSARKTGSANERDDIIQRIDAFLVENPGKLWTVDEVASLLAMSGRTLIRKIRERGTTYQALRDTALKRQAKIYLATMSVEAAGLALGFADTSSFRRTFKRWFGCNPSALGRIN